jgi:homocysteine S-methyltransferase
LPNSADRQTDLPGRLISNVTNLLAYASFSKRLCRGDPLLIDGGLATQCETMGCDINNDLWSAQLLLSNPRAIVHAHRAFLDAGAELIITASYQASRAGLMAHGLSAKQADELIVKSVSLAMRARNDFLRDNPTTEVDPLVAASIGPYGAALNDGSEYTGQYDVSTDELREFHRGRLELLADSGADLLACETIPSIEEAKVLCELLENIQSPAWVSFSCVDEGHLSDGTPIVDAAKLFHHHASVLAVGVNCTAPQFIPSIIAKLKDAAPDKAIVAYPNSGETCHVEDNSWSGTATDMQCEQLAQQWIDAGANVVGGCCRISSSHIAAMARCDALSQRFRVNRGDPV